MFCTPACQSVIFKTICSAAAGPGREKAAPMDILKASTNTRSSDFLISLSFYGNGSVFAGIPKGKTKLFNNSLSVTPFFKPVGPLTFTAPPPWPFIFCLSISC